MSSQNRNDAQPNRTGPILTERVPPQAIELEESVLGAMMLSRDTVTEVMEHLQPGDFYQSRNRYIYEAITELFDQNQPTDLLMVTQQLERNGALDKAGGRSRLMEIAQTTATAINAAQHAMIVAEKALLRDLITVTTQIATEAYDASQDVEQLLARAQQEIYAITESRTQKGFIELKQILGELHSTIEKRSRGEIPPGLATGFLELDRMLVGLNPSDLIILAARPAIGKTSLAISIARNIGLGINVARKAKGAEPFGVGLFSMEMACEQLAMRLLATESGIATTRLRKADDFVSSDWSALWDAIERLNDLNLFIDDTPALSPRVMRARARQLVANHGVSIIMVDYLQLIHPDRRADNRVQEISEISRFLKGLARELKIPILALSQLSRATESREDKRPQLSDLRESGAIEQDADVVLFIHRPEAYGIFDATERDFPDEKYIPSGYQFEDVEGAVLSSSQQDEDNKGGFTTKERKPVRAKRIIKDFWIEKAEIIVAKHRNGPTGRCVLKFTKDLTEFGNLTEERTPPPPDGMW